MAVATFDTLKFANALKAAGVPSQQAEAESAILAEMMQLNLKELVTKDDLAATKVELKQEIKDTEQRLTVKIDNGLADLRLQFVQLKGDMTLLKWMLGLGLPFGLTMLGIILRLLLIRTPI